MGADGWAADLVGHELHARYRLDRLVGEGGMGAVFAATDMPHDVGCAIKLIAPQLAMEPEFLKRFEQEAFAATAVGGAGVVECLHFDTDPTLGPYLVMELLEGETLGSKLRRDGAMDPRQSVELTTAILDTLEVVHARGIVHRDLKPGNVFLVDGVDGPERYKLLDFGVSRVREVGRGTLLTMPGTILGTPRYTAPEQLADASGVDPRADVYSAGAILYCCLSGRAPYRGLRGNQLIRAVVTEAPQSLRELRPGLPDILYTVVDTAMARKAADRFQSATAMASALQTLTEVGPISRRPSSSSHPSSRPPPAAAQPMPATVVLPSVRPPAPQGSLPPVMDANSLAAIPPTKQATLPEHRPRPVAAPSLPDTEPRTTRRRRERRPIALYLLLVMVASAVGASAALFATGVWTLDSLGLAPDPEPTVRPQPPMPTLPSPPAPDPVPVIPSQVQQTLDQGHAQIAAGAAAEGRALFQSVLDGGCGERGSGAARGCAEARLAIGDVESAPLRRIPHGASFAAVQLGYRGASAIYQRSIGHYGEVGTFGHLDLTQCGMTRSGELSERMAAAMRVEGTDGLDRVIEEGAPPPEAIRQSATEMRSAGRTYFEAATSRGFGSGRCYDDAQAGLARLAVGESEPDLDGGR